MTSSCFDDRFVIRGVAFRKAHVQAPAVVVKPPAAPRPPAEAEDAPQAATP